MAKYLISEAIRTARRGVCWNWAGANDFIVPQPAIETGESLVFSALEAKAAITLSIRYWRAHPSSRISWSRASVNSRRTTFFDVVRKAEGAHHIAIHLALPVHITDILLADGAGVAELETNTVAFQYIALAIGDAVVDEATRLGAERVCLVLANHEGGLGIERWIQVEAERWYGEQLDDYYDRGSFKKPPDNFQTHKHLCGMHVRPVQPEKT
jgi:hypothetical protein